ncbi:MAG: hypothetical protein V7727_16100 [Sneathiella sp.]
MNYTFQIKPCHNLVLDKFVGKTSQREFFEAIQKSSFDPEFRVGMDVLADMTQIELEFGHEGARALVSQISKTPKMEYGKIALVISTTLQFGITRMFGLIAEEKGVFSEYQVFRDFSEARNWLGLPEDLELEI